MRPRGVIRTLAADYTNKKSKHCAMNNNYGAFFMTLRQYVATQQQFSLTDEPVLSNEKLTVLSCFTKVN